MTKNVKIYVRYYKGGDKVLKLNEKVMYGTTGVCVVQSVEDKRIGKEIKKYYVLKPVSQTSSTVYIPADNEKLLSKVRRVLSVEEIKTMLSSLSDEPDIWTDNDNERREKFSEIITSGDRKACLVLVRTLHNRQSALSGTGKRLHIADERALKEAQRLIQDEFSVVLNIQPCEVGAYIKCETENI